MTDLFDTPPEADPPAQARRVCDWCDAPAVRVVVTYTGMDHPACDVCGRRYGRNMREGRTDGN